MIVRSLCKTFDILFPAHCIVCHRRVRGKSLCQRCTPKALGLSHANRCDSCFTVTINLDESGRCQTCRTIPLVFHRIRYLWDYHDQARDLITTMKYQPSPILNKVTAKLLGEHFRELYPLPDWDLILPVPSSPSSIRKRTFNQCVLLSKAAVRASRPHRAQYSSGALRYVGQGITQASLHGSPRLRNVRRSFSANSKSVHEKSVLLVDDVITTGATGTACALALLDAGASRVDLAALARANNWHEFRQEVYEKMK